MDLPVCIYVYVRVCVCISACVCDQDSRKKTSAIIWVRSLVYVMYAVVRMAVVGMGIGKGQGERRKL